MRTAFAKEPKNIAKYQDPELSFRGALKKEINSILSNLKSNGSISNYLLLEEFGLDLAVFIELRNRINIKFFELKAFVGQRNRGVGIGDAQGKGTQVDLLLLSDQQIRFTDNFIKWILINTELGPTLKYFFFNCWEAKVSAMGGIVKRGKHNNINVDYLLNIVNPISWDDLSQKIENYLLN